MRYAQGGGLTAEGRRRREQARLEAARRFEQRAPTAVIAAELRVSERSVRRWRQAWQAAARPGWPPAGRPRSAGSMSGSWRHWMWGCRPGPLAAGWNDQRWTLGRVRDLI